MAEHERTERLSWNQRRVLKRHLRRVDKQLKRTDKLDQQDINKLRPKLEKNIQELLQYMEFERDDGTIVTQGTIPELSIAEIKDFLLQSNELLRKYM